MSRVVRTRRVKVDVDQIWVYVAERNYSAADRLLDRFDAALSQLARNPYLGEGVDHIRPGLRRFPVGSYLLFFDPLSDGIRLERVVHAARSLRGMFDDDA